MARIKVNIGKTSAMGGLSKMAAPSPKKVRINTGNSKENKFTKKFRYS